MPPAHGVKGGSQTSSASGGLPPPMVPAPLLGPGSVALAMDHLDERLRLLLADRRQSNESLLAALAHPQGGPAPSQQELGPTRGSAATGGVTGASSTVVKGAARWGTSEGGLDGLGWVRGLVNSGGSLPSALAAATPATTGGNRREDATTGGNRREDVVLLQSWLEEMMARVKTGALLAPPGSSFSAASASLVQQQLIAVLPGSSGDGGGGSTRPLSGEKSPGSTLSPSDLADGALRIYGIAFGELRKQVGRN